MKKLLALASMLTIDMVGCDRTHDEHIHQFDLNILRQVELTREQVKVSLCYNIAAYDSGEINADDAAIQGFEGTL